jgi:hypothetical protein
MNVRFTRNALADLIKSAPLLARKIKRRHPVWLPA